MEFQKNQQTVLNSLIKDYGYSKSQIKTNVEMPLENGRRTILDFVVFQTAKAADPLIIIQLKKPLLLPASISQLENYLESLKAEYGMLTDGKKKYCLRMEEGSFTQIPDIPRMGENSLEFPNKSTLVPFEDALFKLWNVANILRHSKLRTHDAIEELSKLLLCKILDERSPNGFVRFWVTSEELRRFETSDAFLGRMNMILQSVTNLNPAIPKEKLRFKLNTALLRASVAELQAYSISQSPRESLIAFGEFFARAFHDSGKLWGGFHIPETVVSLIVKALEVGPTTSFLDPSCGAGYLLRGVIVNRFDNSESSAKVMESIDSRIYGAEQSMTASLIAELFMTMAGSSGRSIITEDSLSPGASIDQVVRDIGGFDRIGSFPPMSVRVTNREILDASIIAKGKTTYTNTGLFFERCYSWLRPDGRMALVVPDGFLFGSGERAARKFIVEHFRVLAIINLPSGVLKPFTGVRVSLILLEKAPGPIETDYNMLLASFDSISSDTVDKKIKRIIQALRDMEGGAVFSQEGLLTTSLSTLREQEWSMGSYGMHQILGEQSGTELAKIGRISTGIAVSSREYTDPTKTTTPYIRIGDLSDGLINAEGLKHIEQAKAPSSKRLQERDVLVSLTGTIGKSSIVAKEFEGAVPNSQIAVIRPDVNKICPEFLVHVLSSPKIQETLKKLDSGALISHLRITELRKVKIPVPTLDEQNAIVEKLSILREKRDRHLQESGRVQQELENLERRVWDGY